jgi:hypothetical protein
VEISEVGVGDGDPEGLEVHGRHSSRLTARSSPGGENPAVTPTCVWRLRPEILRALDERFGVPTDSYVNGSQVWLRNDAPGGGAVEWRLHPVAGFRRPPGVGTYDLFGEVVFALAQGTEPPAPPDQLWDGLEAFPIDQVDVEPVPLAAALTEALGIAPDRFGLVDHQVIGDAWERSEGRMSIVAALLGQLDEGESLG